jgi:hypothetical protein
MGPVVIVHRSDLGIYFHPPCNINYTAHSLAVRRMKPMPQPSSQDELKTPATLFSYIRTAIATLVLRSTVFNDTKWPASIEMLIPLLYLLGHTTQKTRLCGHQTYSYTDESNNQKQMSDTQAWWHRRPPCPEWESSTFHARKVNARTHIVIVQPSCTSVAVLDYLPAVRPWVGWCEGATLRTNHQAFLNSKFSWIFSGRQLRQGVKVFRHIGN